MARPIDRSAIVWAYRLFLGREPENEAVVRTKQRDYPTIAALCRAFFESSEFRAGQGTQSHPSLDGLEPPMRIVPLASPTELQQLFAHIQATWQWLGETEPHWSVLTSPEFKQDNLSETKDRFYSSGSQCLAMLKAALARCGVDYRRLTTAIEYGCGVGRFTQWLAGQLRTVHAYDISSAHLKIAQDHLAENGLKNIEYHHVRSLDDLASLPKVDLVYSCIVLQHNPPPIIEFLLERLLGTIGPGGVGYLQLPTHIHDYGFELASYLQQAGSRREVEMHALPQRRVFELVRDSGCAVLEVLDDDNWTGLGHHNVSSVFVVQKSA